MHGQLARHVKLTSRSSGKFWNLSLHPTKEASIAIIVVAGGTLLL